MVGTLTEYRTVKRVVLEYSWRTKDWKIRLFFNKGRQTVLPDKYEGYHWALTAAATIPLVQAWRQV